MSKDRLEKILSLYRDYSTDEHLIGMVAELRDSFLDHDLVSRQTGYDIAEITPTGPDHVVYYIAEYISILEKQAERVQELERQNKALKLEVDGWFSKANETHESMLRQDKVVDKFREQNKRYREALEFYSEESNYSGYLTAGGWVKTPINDDNGETARQALKGDRNESR